mmetsp:Transcript_48360/g.149381  ORF Transcript_48360/g.149381 Transcript_48360/m.149381 type:complete len:87 (+) Transcript_48360:1325-1585(+)
MPRLAVRAARERPAVCPAPAAAPHRVRRTSVRSMAGQTATSATSLQRRQQAAQAEAAQAPGVAASGGAAPAGLTPRARGAAVGLAR